MGHQLAVSPAATKSICGAIWKPHIGSVKRLRLHRTVPPYRRRRRWPPPWTCASRENGLAAAKRGRSASFALPHLFDNQRKHRRGRYYGADQSIRQTFALAEFNRNGPPALFWQEAACGSSHFFHVSGAAGKKQHLCPIAPSSGQCASETSLPSMFSPECA